VDIADLLSDDFVFVVVLFVSGAPGNFIERVIHPVDVVLAINE